MWDGVILFPKPSGGDSQGRRKKPWHVLSERESTKAFYAGETLSLERNKNQKPDT